MVRLRQLIDLNPSRPSSAGNLWRESTRDKLSYNAFTLIRPGKKSNARIIGSIRQAQLFWVTERFLSLVAIWVIFPRPGLHGNWPS